MGGGYRLFILKSYGGLVLLFLRLFPNIEMSINNRLLREKEKTLFNIALQFKSLQISLVPNFNCNYFTISNVLLVMNCDSITRELLKILFVKRKFFPFFAKILQSISKNLPNG